MNYSLTKEQYQELLTEAMSLIQNSDCIERVKGKIMLSVLNEMECVG